MQRWVPLAGVTLFAAMLVLLIFGRRMGQPLQAWRYAAAVMLVAALAGMAVACGGGGGSMGPPPNPGSAPVGPNAITVTASSGNTSHPAVYTMTLQ